MDKCVRLGSAAQQVKPVKNVPIARLGEGGGSRGLAYVDLDASGFIVELAQLPEKETEGE
jgi:hypothetical protein